MRRLALRSRLPAWRPAGDPVAPTIADRAVGAEVAVATQPVANAGASLRPLAVDADGRPSRLVLVRAIHQSTGLPRVMPGFDALIAALRRLNFNGTASVGWVGPYPRVVRKSIPGGVETHVAWLHQLNLDPRAFVDTQIAAGQRRLARDVGVALVTITGGPESVSQWSDVSVDPFNAANHGPADWWRSGYAARTRTRDREPGLIDVDMQENPLGPDAADLQNPDYLLWVTQQAGGTVGGFSWGLAVGGVVAFGGALYLAAKFSGGSREVVVRAEGVRRAGGR